jgi:hypothetical protein
MTFIPKIKFGPTMAGTLAVAVLGLLGPGRYAAPTSDVVTPNRSVVAQNAGTAAGASVIPAVAVGFAPGTESFVYQPVTHFYKNKGWWKRNAPIIGGAGGGALVGGLVGGGTGALVGGAVGGGGGYLYKRHRRHEEYRHGEYYHHH